MSPAGRSLARLPELLCSDGPALTGHRLCGSSGPHHHRPPTGGLGHARRGRGPLGYPGRRYRHHRESGPQTLERGGESLTLGHRNGGQPLALRGGGRGRRPRRHGGRPGEPAQRREGRSLDHVAHGFVSFADVLGKTPAPYYVATAASDRSGTAPPLVQKKGIVRR